jgi:predicted ABC-type sugar transport system permease subunit
VVLAVVAWRFFAGDGPTATGPRGGGWRPDGDKPVPVKVIAAVQEPLALYIKALGTVTPLKTVTVRSPWSAAVARTKVTVDALSAAFVGVAGLLQFSKLSVGDPTVAVGLELDVIAAVIIGGGSLSGGRGTVAGTLIGAAIMTIIQIGCSQKGLANWVQQIVTGGIIVAAVALDRIRSSRTS